jgi:hypothetical protein
MLSVDAAILDLTEWCCRRFQMLTGRTNVWLAIQLTNLSIIIYFVWAGVYFLDSEIEARIGITVFCGALLYALTQTVFKVPIETYETNAYTRVAKGLRNPRRVRDALLRISFLTLAVLLFGPVVFVYMHRRELPEALANLMQVATLSYSLVVFTTVVLYLLACDPLPPCTGKLRIWIRGATPARVPSPETPSNSRAA